MPKKLTREEFIRRANEVHKGKYDYSKVVYVNNRTKVCIISPDYGEFWITPNHHLSGVGKTRIHAHTRESFISEANKVHRGLYDYSLIGDSFKGKIPIICKAHGIFYQTRSNHLSGHGCPFCRNDSYKSAICGIGINDLMLGRESEAYTLWRNMIVRCYDEGRLVRHPTYRGVTVCSDWLKLSAFKKWFDQNVVKGYSLDKDIINKGNKVYSPDNCCFVPPEINTLFTRRHLHRGPLPIGVSFKHGKYYASISMNGKMHGLGHYDMPELAFAAYKSAKEAYIKEVATEYFSRDKITRRVYDALMRYEVEISD